MSPVAWLQVSGVTRTVVGTDEPCTSDVSLFLCVFGVIPRIGLAFLVSHTSWGCTLVAMGVHLGTVRMYALCEWAVQTRRASRDERVGWPSLRDRLEYYADAVVAPILLRITVKAFICIMSWKKTIHLIRCYPFHSHRKQVSSSSS